ALRRVSSPSNVVARGSVATATIGQRRFPTRIAEAILVGRAACGRRNCSLTGRSLSTPCPRRNGDYVHPAMKIDQLTVKAREALASSREIAMAKHHAEIAPEHLLAALLEQDGGVVPRILTKLGADPRVVR